MLDRKCKKIIKCCAKNFTEKCFINTDDLQKHLNFSKMEIYYCCKRLHELGYFDDFSSAIEYTVHIQLGYKTFNYKDFKHTQIKEFIFKSVLIPILVSVLASTIVTMLTLMLVQKPT